MADHLDNVTKKAKLSTGGRCYASLHYIFTETTFPLYFNLLTGSTASPCPLPCSTFYTDTRFLAETASPTLAETNNSALLSLLFSSKVVVTSTDFPSSPLGSFMAEVGGCLGLWLGLGVLQVLQLLVPLAKPLFNAWPACTK